jgi:hypothetical protein
VTRILLIGNSHIAAFRKAWDGLRDTYAEVDIDFFAKPGPDYYSLRLDAQSARFGALDESEFTTAQLNGLERFNGKRVVDISGYDQIMVVGNQHGLADLIWLIAHRDVTGLRQTNANQLLSAGAFEAIVQDIATSFLPDPQWAVWEQVPVTFHAMPRPAETVFDKLDPKSNLGRTYANLNANQDGLREAMVRLGLVFEAQLKTMGLRFAEQPEATMNTYGFSQSRYNPQRENSEHKPDYSHMSSEYGALCLHAAFADILPRK